jgi:hypothetical protein
MGRLRNGAMTIAAKKSSGERKVHIPVRVAFFQSLVGIYTYVFLRTCRFPLSLATILGHLATLLFFTREEMEWLTRHELRMAYLTLFLLICCIDQPITLSRIVQLPFNLDSG